MFWIFNAFLRFNWLISTLNNLGTSKSGKIGDLPNFAFL